MTQSLSTPKSGQSSQVEIIAKELILTDYPRMLVVPLLIGDAFTTISGQFKHSGDFKAAEAANISIISSASSGDISDKIKSINIGTTGTHLYASKSLPQLPFPSAIVKLNTLFYLKDAASNINCQIDCKMIGSPIRYITENIILNGNIGTYAAVTTQIYADIQNLAGYSYFSIDFTTTSWYDKAILAGAYLIFEEKE